MRNQDKYNTETVKELLLNDNIILLDTYIDAKTKMLCKDNEGYLIYIVLSNYLTRHGIGRRFDKSNEHTIDNINHYLFNNNLPFRCISNSYISAHGVLDFICLRCNEIINTTWCNVNKHDNINRNHILCPNCDGRNESIHASVLKQMFLHYYSDTIVEDKTFRSPITNRICPTDIVNHRLRIAVEIQSQWHDFPDTKIRDRLKKEFWISKGYTFYDPDIRDYSVLELCRMFFDIDKLPDWIDYKLGNKINIKNIQDMLNSNYSVHEIGEHLQINYHRIYDAIHSKKLYYPKNYKYKNNIKEEYILQESSETAGHIW